MLRTTSVLLGLGSVGFALLGLCVTFSSGCDQPESSTQDETSDPVSAAVQRGTSPTSDLEQLQGTWEIVETRKQDGTVEPGNARLQWCFEADKLRMASGDGSPSQFRQFVLDTNKHPKHLDLVVRWDEGKAMSILMVYELTGDKLTIGMKDDFSRPTGFGTGTIVWTLTRAKAR